MVDTKLVLELQQIIKEVYGKDLSTKEVSEYVRNWVLYFDLLAKVSHRIKTADGNG